MSKTAFLGIFAYVLCLPFPPAGGEETLAERSLSCASAAQQLKVFYEGVKCIFAWMDHSIS